MENGREPMCSHQVSAWVELKSNALRTRLASELERQIEVSSRLGKVSVDL